LILPGGRHPAISDRSTELLAALLFITERLCAAANDGDADRLRTEAERLHQLAELLLEDTER
jgi:hypothetical protein